MYILVCFKYLSIETINNMRRKNQIDLFKKKSLKNHVPV